MAATIAGVAGFLLLFGVEAAELAGRGALSTALLVAGRAAVLLAHFLLFALSGRVDLPVAVRIAGGLLAACGMLMLLQSLLFELPRRSGAPPRLVTSGTYALVRHPGVLWFGLWLAGLAALSGARDLALAAPAWLAADVAYAWFEDRWAFPRLFGADWQNYRRRVPMFLPRPATVRSFARSFRPFRRGVSSGPGEGAG